MMSAASLAATLAATANDGSTAAAAAANASSTATTTATTDRCTAAVSAAPAVPAISAAPAISAIPSIAAPIPALALPTVVVPAIPAAPENIQLYSLGQRDRVDSGPQPAGCGDCRGFSSTTNHRQAGRKCGQRRKSCNEFAHGFLLAAKRKRRPTIKVMHNRNSCPV